MQVSALESNRHCFNTQPPEGGWVGSLWQRACRELFQHTAARRRLAKVLATCHLVLRVFQHTAARRRLAMPRLYDKRLVLFQHTAARRRLGRSLRRTSS